MADDFTLYNIFVMKKMQTILPPKPFILVRHGQTIANLKGQTCGQLNSPLTMEGQRQSQRLACKLKPILSPRRSIIHTGLIRSKETAEIIAASQDLQPILISGLSEHHFGTLEGEPWPKVLALLEEGQQPPGGESRLQFVQRIQRTLYQVLETYTEPIIVAHGGTFFAIAYTYGFFCQDVKNCEALHFFPKIDPLFPWHTYQIRDTLPWQPYNFLK